MEEELDRGPIRWLSRERQNRLRELYLNPPEFAIFEDRIITPGENKMQT